VRDMSRLSVASALAPVLVLTLLACGGEAPPPAAPTTPAPAAATPAPVASIALPPWASLYPATRTTDANDVLFGTVVPDPYRWLEDATQPEVQAWMKAQDDLARAKLTALPDRAAIAARAKELFYVDSQGMPSTRGNLVFYGRRTGTQEKSVAYWREGKTGAEHVMLDPNSWSADGSKSLHDWSVSWDGKRVAYTVSENNSDEATMHVMEVASGKVSTVDVIPGAKYSYASWTPKGDGFYYTRLPVDPKIPTDQRPGYAEVRFHSIGTDPATDPLVREKTGDPATFVGGWISKDGRFLFSQVSHGWSSNDAWFRDMTKKSTEWTPISVGKDAQYNPMSFKGRLYVATNEGAPKWRVFSIDPAHVDRASWKEIVPERTDATLDSVSILGGKLVLTYLKDVVSQIEIHDLDGKLVRVVSLPAVGSAGMTGDPDRDEAYFSFETYNYPFEIHATSIAHGGDSVWWKTKLPIDPSLYAVDQVFFPSKDGARIPMFVVHAKTAPRDGTAPAMLTGYGGFNSSETPAFSKGIFPWLERGGIYAFASLRGGGEYGEEWHRAGMLHAKQNVFDDFEAAAAYLAKEKYTSADRLVIQGASNGGLLIGAAVTQRPDLFRAAICGVPLLDMVRYEKFGSGRTWSSEYGTVAKEDDFRALFAYSPYHHVVPGVRYPSVLMDSADADDRVDPMHARKFTAELQADSTGGPVLLRIERHSGHGGADLMKSWVERIADRYAFAFAEIKEVGGSVK
jgi:prolyl oligopeptidase